MIIKNKIQRKTTIMFIIFSIVLGVMFLLPNISFADNSENKIIIYPKRSIRLHKEGKKQIIRGEYRPLSYVSLYDSKSFIAVVKTNRRGVFTYVLDTPLDPGTIHILKYFPADSRKKEIPSQEILPKYKVYPQLVAAGVIRDSFNGKNIPNVLVRLTDEATGNVKEIKTDKFGEYEVPFVTDNTNIRVEKEGYLSKERKILAGKINNFKLKRDAGWEGEYENENIIYKKNSFFASKKNYFNIYVYIIVGSLSVAAGGTIYLIIK